MANCFFIGHRDTKDNLLPELIAEIERHIAVYGVTEFIVGRYGSFDALASKAVKTVKERHPEVLLTCLLPYHPGERPIKLPDYFDGSFYPPLQGVPRRFAIVRANQYMVDHSDFLIAYAWHPASNSRELVEYARKREQRGLIRVTLLGKNKLTSN